MLSIVFNNLMYIFYIVNSCFFKGFCILYLISHTSNWYFTSLSLTIKCFHWFSENRNLCYVFDKYTLVHCHFLFFKVLGYFLLILVTDNLSHVVKFILLLNDNRNQHCFLSHVVKFILLLNDNRNQHCF